VTKKNVFISFEKEENYTNSFKIESLSESKVEDISTEWSSELSLIIESIWKDKAIQQALIVAKSELHIFDGAEHFFGNLERFRDPHTYKVTVDDALYCRRKNHWTCKLYF